MSNLQTSTPARIYVDVAVRRAAADWGRRRSATSSEPFDDSPHSFVDTGNQLATKDPVDLDSGIDYGVLECVVRKRGRRRKEIEREETETEEELKVISLFQLWGVGGVYEGARELGSSHAPPSRLPSLHELEWIANPTS
ncbi:hypothetical protein Scep_009384 [Stephania cephalantha]|uniref:Uncharacterized protein n=1 Tax=Stephania cephalantha TaxID=152367 RepID=A0AAP0PCH2_9MAGN